MLEQLNETNYEEVKTWWEKHNFPALPLMALPSTSFVAKVGLKRVAFASLYLPRKPDGGCIGWLDWVVTNPDTHYNERTVGLKEVLDHCDKLAKEYGLLFLYTISPNEKYVKRMEGFGYSVVERNNTNMIKFLLKDEVCEKETKSES